jgi:hypothetical protein
VATRGGDPVDSEAPERLLVAVLQRLEAPEVVKGRAQRRERELDARRRGGRGRRRAEGVQDKLLVSSVPGRDAGDELQGGGCPDREGPQGAQESNRAAPALLPKLLPADAAEELMHGRVLVSPAHGARLEVLRVAGLRHRQACSRPPRGRDDAVEAIHLLPERAVIAIRVPPAEQVSSKGRRQHGVVAIEGVMESVAALVGVQVRPVAPGLAAALVAPVGQVVPEDEEVREGVEARQVLEGKEAALVVRAVGQ